MVEPINTFLNGAGFMFSLMLAWFFYRNRHDMLSRFVVTLMTLIAIGFLKDLVITLYSWGEKAIVFATMIDILAVPAYAFILYELCVPGCLTVKKALIVELPFLILLFSWCAWPLSCLYYADLTLAIVLGVSMATWTLFAIPRYNKHLMATFSYDEDINLKWLQSILWTFFIILIIWGTSCIWYNPWFDVIYVCFSIVLWSLICYFIFKHQSVVDELKPNTACLNIPTSKVPPEVLDRIHKVIYDEKAYLNPRLKLSDIARMADTNRTYASSFFNSTDGQSFFNIINSLRVEYAKELLANTDLKIETVASEAGFNSRQSFHRIFSSIVGLTPNNFRSTTQSTH